MIEGRHPLFFASLSPSLNAVGPFVFLKANRLGSHGCVLQNWRYTILHAMGLGPIIERATGRHGVQASHGQGSNCWGSDIHVRGLR